MVTVGTVTAQLLYEIGGPRYLSPDAVPRFDTHRAGAGGPRPGAHRAGARRGAARHAEGHGQPRRRLAQRHDAGPDRRPAGREGTVRGGDRLGRHPGRPRRLRRDRGRPLGRPDRRRHGVPAPGRARRRRAGGGPGLLGRRRRDEPVELPGHVLHLGPVRRAGCRPLLADDGAGRRGDAAHRVRRPTGPGHASHRLRPARPPARPCRRRRSAPRVRRRRAGGDTVVVPLWVLVGARSGDKGGDANVGVWADDDAVAAWLQDEFTHGAAQGLAARGRALPGQPVPAAEPAGGELRRPRPPRLGRGVEPAAGHAGEGPRRAAALAPGRGAGRAGGERARRRRGSPRADGRPRRAAARASGRMAPWSRSPVWSRWSRASPSSSSRRGACSPRSSSRG